MQSHGPNLLYSTSGPERERCVVGVGAACGSRSGVELLTGGAATIKGVVLDLPGASGTTPCVSKDAETNAGTNSWNPGCDEVDGIFVSCC